MQSSWINIEKEKPIKEGYYKIKYSDGKEDQKPFRIRPSKGINGFMTLDKVTHWKKK